MLGGFRLVLAVVVVMFHLGFRPFGLWMGISAVVAFYMISGYAMSALWQRCYADGDVVAFCLDRWLRLYPQYIAFCAISAVLAFGFGIKLVSFTRGEPSWITAVSHISMVLLCLAALIPAISQFTLIPQGWSLGTEMAFYLLFPAIQSRVATTIAILVSLVVFTVASLGYIDPPPVYAFYLPPGCLFVFLIGALIQRDDLPLLTCTVTLYAMIVGLLVTVGKFSISFNREILIGVVVSLIAVSTLTKLKGGTIDAFLGDLSYGVYLSHYISLSIVNHVGWSGGDVLGLAAIVTGGSLIMGTIGLFLVERPVARFRKKLRALHRSVVLPAGRRSAAGIALEVTGSGTLNINHTVSR